MTGKLDAFAPDANVIHVDIDPAEIGKNRVVEVPIVGDCKDVIGKLANELGKRQDEAGGVPDRKAWLGQLEAWKKEFPYAYDQQPDGPAEAAVLHRAAARGRRRRRDRRLGRRPAPDVGVAVLEVREAAAVDQLGRAWARWASRCRRRSARRRACPTSRVIAIDGDGCFQMTAQELATSTTENIPFVTAIINNAYLGMVRQWQELFYDERYSQVHLTYDTPDYVKLAEAYGCVGLRAEHPDEVDAVIEKALSITDRSVVIDFRVDSKEMCFPMVPAGASNDDIITGPEGLKRANDPAEAPIA